MTSTPSFVPRTLTLLFITAIGAAGCVPPKGDLGEYSATEATGGATGLATTEAEATTGDTTDSATGEPAFPICVEADPSIDVRVDIVAPTLAPSSPLQGELDVPCTVQSTSATEIALQCAGDDEVVHDVTLTLRTPTPKTGLLGGETEVRLRYRDFEMHELEQGVRTHLSLHARDDGSLLLFYADGLDLFEPQFADFWAPLQITDVEPGACPAVPDGDPACQIVERSALEVELDGQQAIIFDRNVATFASGSLSFYVDHALRLGVTGGDGCFDFSSGRSQGALALVADP